MNFNGKLFVLSAPSGAGKTTLCRKLLEEFSNKLTLSISSTTRPPRGSERDGVDYFFVDKARFEADIARGAFAEWAKVHDHFYGTSKSVIDHAFATGKHVLLDIDVQGAASLLKAYPEQCVTIFVSPPSLEILHARLRSRKTDSEEVIQKRMRNARNEMARRGEFKYEVVNEELETCYLQVGNIFVKEAPDLDV